MSQRTKNIKIKAYKSASSVATRSFQANLVPEATYSGEALYRRLAMYLDLQESDWARARRMVEDLEGFIQKELEEGNRLDFGLVSFFPRLSESLSTRDADPAEEGIYVRGAVKARKTLAESLAKKLIAVNSQSEDALRIVAAIDAEDKDFAYDGFRLCHEVGILNYNLAITIDPTHEDEKIWLEKPIKHRRQEHKPLAYAQYLGMADDGWRIRCKFDAGAVSPGTYMLCISTRAGKGLEYRLRTIRHKVIVLA